MAATDIPTEAARRFDSVLWLAIRARPRMLTDAAASGLNERRLEVGDVDTLEQIVAVGPCPMSEVAAVLRVDPSTAGRSVNRLVDLGLVARRTSAGDGRVVLVTVTDGGRAAQREASARRTALACRILEHLHPDDQDAVGQLWPALGAAMIEFLDLPPEAGANPDPSDLAGSDDEQAARLMRNGAVLGSVWRTMRRSKPAIISRSVDGRFEPRLETSDVDTLELIAGVDGTAQTSQIATALGVASSTASQAVSRLVERGLVYRTQDVGDRRVFRLALTEPGQQAFDIVRAGRMRFARQVIAEFSPPDQATLHRVLPLLAEGVKREFVRQPAAAAS